MYRRRTPGAKRDPVKRWNLPDRVFFACGACHILAYAFLERYPNAGFRAVWIRPVGDMTGNHIVVVSGDRVFDYHGYAHWPAYREHTWQRARQRWPGWDAALVPLLAPVLVSERLSRGYQGLWLREPGQFLHDALPRAHRYLDRFSAPSPNAGL